MSAQRTSRACSGIECFAEIEGKMTEHEVERDVQRPLVGFLKHRKGATARFRSALPLFVFLNRTFSIAKPFAEIVRR